MTENDIYEIPDTIKVFISNEHSNDAYNYLIHNMELSLGIDFDIHRFVGINKTCFTFKRIDCDIATEFKMLYG